MWKKTQGWRFYCAIDWSVLEREGQKDCSDKNPVTVWYKYMKRSTPQTLIVGQRLGVELVSGLGEE
eukprot:9302915-Prorocentrum_lima.AAC.1